MRSASSFMAVCKTQINHNWNQSVKINPASLLSATPLRNARCGCWKVLPVCYSLASNPLGRKKSQCIGTAADH